jgi:putative SOS response-associated peptidase YedK
MCFYVHVKIKKEDVKKQYQSLNPDFKDFIYPTNEIISGFDKPLLPILILQTNYQLDTYNWGLIPEWAAFDEKFALSTLNAREETLLIKPSFKDFIDSQRGILPVHGFYEWQHVGKQKIKHLITHANQPLLNIGVVYHRFVNQEKREIKTFSIITQKANLLMEKIHNTKKRMPLMIPNGEEEIWLSKNLPYETSMKQMSHLRDDELYAIQMIDSKESSQTSLF